MPNLLTMQDPLYYFNLLFNDDCYNYILENTILFYKQVNKGNEED